MMMKFLVKIEKKKRKRTHTLIFSVAILHHAAAAYNIFLTLYSDFLTFFFLKPIKKKPDPPISERCHDYIVGFGLVDSKS